MIYFAWMKTNNSRCLFSFAFFFFLLLGCVSRSSTTLPGAFFPAFCPNRDPCGSTWTHVEKSWRLVWVARAAWLSAVLASPAGVSRNSHSRGKLCILFLGVQAQSFSILGPDRPVLRQIMAVLVVFHFFGINQGVNRMAN